MPVRPIAFFQSQDAILDVDTPPALRAHTAEAPHHLHKYTTALADSYDGIPDMLRLLMRWADGASLPSAALVRDAAAATLRNHPTVVSHVDARLHAHAPPHPLLASMLRDPHWNPTAAALARQHPDSALSFHVSRYRALAEAALSTDAPASPRALVATVLRLFRDLFDADGPPTDAAVRVLRQRVALLATQDECAAIVTMQALDRLQHRTSDPLVRSVARVVAQSTLARIARLVPPKTRHQRYALHLSGVATARLTVAQAGPVLALLSGAGGSGGGNNGSNGAGTPGARRRPDVDTPTLRAIAAQLLGAAAPAAAPAGGDGDDVEVVEVAPAARPAQVADAAGRVHLARNLTHPAVVSTLQAALFSATDAPRDPGRRSALATLLALAAALDRRTDADLAAALATPETLSRDVASASAALLATAAACEQVARAGAPPARSSHALRVIAHSVGSDELCARGALSWAREMLLLPGVSVAVVKRALLMIKEAASHHVLLREPALRAVRGAFAHNEPTLEPLKRADRREMLVKWMVSLISTARMGTPVVKELLDHWLDLAHFTADHVRLFIRSTLGSIAPPYPQHFATALLALLQHPRVAEVLNRDPDISRIVMDFRTSAYHAGETKTAIAL